MDKSSLDGQSQPHVNSSSGHVQVYSTQPVQVYSSGQSQVNSGHVHVNSSIGHSQASSGHVQVGGHPLARPLPRPGEITQYNHTRRPNHIQRPLGGRPPPFRPHFPSNIHSQGYNRNLQPFRPGFDYSPQRPIARPVLVGNHTNAPLSGSSNNSLSLEYRPIITKKDEFTQNNQYSNDNPNNHANLLQVKPEYDVKPISPSSELIPRENSPAENGLPSNSSSPQQYRKNSSTSEKSFIESYSHRASVDSAVSREWHDPHRNFHDTRSQDWQVSPRGSIESGSHPSSNLYSHAPHLIYERPMLNNHGVRRETDNISMLSSATQNTAVVREVLMPYTDLEEYRQHVKQSHDPKMQLDFAKQLIAVAEEMRLNPKGIDPKKIKKNRDILHSEAVRWIKKAASGSLLGKPGYPDAIFMLADAYGSGSLGLPIDHDKAFSLYTQASKQNHVASIYRCGVCYEVGAGTKRDNVRACQFYKKAAMSGDTAAMYKVGIILLNGTLGQQKNSREGINWLKRAAAQADETTPHALHELGVLYQGSDPEASNFLVPDPTYAQEFFLKAALLGHAPSQYRLGLAYEYGQLNLPIDPRRSIAWYSKAAEQGDPEAELALSGWYLTGCDNVLAKNDYEAYLWAHKAAIKGLAKAEFAMGYFLETGIGVNCSYEEAFEEARRWYQRAAGQGNKRAIQRLKEIKNGLMVRQINSQDWRADSESRNGECSVM